MSVSQRWKLQIEANEFIWPGPDLRPIPGGGTSIIAYGALPPRFFAHVRDAFLARRSKDVGRVPLG